jgi:hypothetical protein
MKKIQSDYSLMSHIELLEVIENVTSQLKKFTFHNGKMQKVNVEKRSPNKNESINIVNGKGHSNYEVVGYLSVSPAEVVAGKGSGVALYQQETEVFVQLGREIQ